MDETPRRTVRALIVDDQNLVRQGIRGLVQLSDEVEAVGEATDGLEALEQLADLAPDVVLLDLRMPRMDGIATIEAMRERGHETPVLVLTTFDDAELVLGAMRAGAQGYLLKDVTLDQLVGAIRTVAAGGTVLQPALTERVMRAIAPGAGPELSEPGAPLRQPLTERETHVLHLVAGGYTNREVSQMLHLAEGTVKNHVSSILLKLGARDRTQAVLRALQHGILGPSATSR